jgi:hypothetical protein
VPPLNTVAGQILVSLAGDLADDARRGRVAGIVVSGILTGILVSRTISGLVAGAAGWRTVFAVAAAADMVFAIVLLAVGVLHDPGAARVPPCVRWGATPGAAGCLCALCDLIRRECPCRRCAKPTGDADVTCESGPVQTPDTEAAGRGTRQITGQSRAAAMRFAANSPTPAWSAQLRYLTVASPTGCSRKALSAR